MVKEKQEAQQFGSATGVLGVDPGLDGGIAFFHPNCGNNHYERVIIHKIPTTEKIISRQRRRFFDERAFCLIVDNFRKNYGVKNVFLEEVHASSQMGVSSAFSFGRTFGGIRGCLVGLGFTVSLVEPSVWKRKLGLGSSKVDAIALAQKNWPTVKFGKHDGMAEAALIALYGIEHSPEVDPLS